MLKVNNKKTINKLAISSLKQYKLRNLFTLITIVLSVSLIAGFSLMSSAITYAEHKELAKNQHVVYYNVNQDQIQSVTSDARVSEFSVLKNGQRFEQEDYILSLQYISEINSQMLRLELAQGQYPQKANEVLVHDKMLEKMGLEVRVGQKLSLTYLDGTTEEYVVSGLLNAVREDMFAVFYSEEYAKNGSQLKDVPFDIAAQIKDATKMGSDNFVATINQIGENAGVARKDINQNDAFVNSLSYDLNEITMIILICAVVLLVSVLVIYSIFYISISERIRQFGQLRTIGMTQKQVKKMVKKEGAILSLIGSSIGIIIGIIFTACIKPQGINPATFAVYALVIFIANYITVQLSIAKPAKLAATVPPIEALKMTGNQTNSDKMQTKKLQRDLTPISLSMFAAQANRKKSVMTIMSLCLAGVAFMAATTFIDSINEEKYARQSWLTLGEYYLEFSLNAVEVDKNGVTGVQANNPLNDTLMSQIKGIDGVENIIEIQNLPTAYTFNGENDKSSIAPFTANDTELMSSYLEEGKIDYKKMVENKEIIIAHNSIVKEIYGWKFEVGDEIKMRWFNGEKEVEDVFTVAGILKKSNKLYENNDMFKLAFGAGWFMAPQETLDAMMTPNFNLNEVLVISTSDYQTKEADIEKEINSILNGNPLLKLKTLKEAIKNGKDSFAMFTLPLWGASLFVIAFSLINLLNTLISNTMARNTEFAGLSAMGASNKQIATMIFGEGLYFAIINIVITSTLGSFLSYLLIKYAYGNGLHYLVYSFPLINLIVYSVFVLLVTFLISVIIAKIISKKSLVERLRAVE